MKISDLNKKYDELQQKYGAKELHSIYNGGCEDHPDVCFIFMNPTGKNIASDLNWEGIRSPWIGTKNIWKLFYNLDLLDQNIYEEIAGKKAVEWTPEFGEKVYENVLKHRYFITNLGKCTQVDARALSDNVYKQYLALLYQEIALLKPKKIITFGNQVSSIFLNQTINVSKCRKEEFKITINQVEYPVYPVYYPVGNGMRNIVKAIQDIKFILAK